MCKLPEAVMNNEVDGLLEKVNQHIDQSLQYACQSWHKHLVDLHMVPSYIPEITSILDQFLKEKFIFWLEVLSVLGMVRSAVDALEVARGQLKVCQIYAF